MSEADRMLADVETNGVKVRKALNLEDFAVPSLVFTIIGPQDTAATIRIRDPIPEDVGVGDVGFHPKHGGEYWQYEESHVTFSRPFEPGEKIRTVYGVIGADPSAADWFSADPAVELTKADARSIDRTGDGEPNVTDDRNGAGDDALLEQLAREVEGSGDSSAHLDEIREALIGDVDVALEALNEEVAAIRNDLGSMRESTSEEGVPEAVSELPAEVESIHTRLADLEAEVAERDHDGFEPTALTERLDAIEDEVLDGGDRTVGSTESGTLADRVSELEAEIERLTERQGGSPLDEVQDTVDRLASDLEETDNGMQRNARDIDDVGAEVAELVSMVESPTEGRRVDAERIAEIEAGVDELAETLHDVVAFQERLSETLQAIDTD